MSHKADFAGFFGLLLPAVAGFGLVYYLSVQIDRHIPILKAGLVYVGERTLYIFAFHLLAFKLVSMIKVGWYGLPWQQVGGHTVVNAHTGDYFWVLYTIVGVALPLAGLALYRYWAARIDFSLKSCLKYLLAFSIKLTIIIFKLIKKIILALWSCILGSYAAIKDIAKAANPKDE